MSSLTTILSNIEKEARRAPFDVDRDVYRRATRQPTQPILVAGNTDAALCLFARELGHEEVLRGQPLIGAAGRRVRRAIFDRVAPNTAPDPPFYHAALNHVLLTNTVPYKPVGNREYDRETKARFRPFIEDLLVNVWRGAVIVPMGEGAFKWFAQYAPRGVVLDFWDDREARFTGALEVTLVSEADGVRMEKDVTLAPVPHPSPRSPFMQQFPALLEQRLDAYLRPPDFHR